MLELNGEYIVIKAAHSNLKVGFHALFTTSETMDVPIDLYVISFPRRTQEGDLQSSWFGGSSRQASIHVLFLVRAMRFETSIVGAQEKKTGLENNSRTTSSCPIDLSYVETFPWNTTVCREAGDPNGTHCCLALLSLFGIGLSQRLKDTSMFQLPDLASSSSCLSNLQNKLEALSIQPSLVPQCLGSATNFVANTSQCAGIITIQDWNQRVNGTTQLDSSCQGELTEIRCGSCVYAGMQVNYQWENFGPNNIQRCFYFTVMYTAGIASEFGPKDVRTASCILGIPLSSSASNKSGNHLSRTTQLKLIFGLLGALVGVLLALGVIIFYRRWDKKESQNAVHEEYVSSFKSSVLPNAGGKWFRVSELEQATDGFSQRNLIGQGDEDFHNEVEIISKIRHRNLLALRGCCVTSDNLKGRD
nr:putative receptor-like protein kinase [Quercus suber]